MNLVDIWVGILVGTLLGFVPGWPVDFKATHAPRRLWHQGAMSLGPHLKGQILGQNVIHWYSGRLKVKVTLPSGQPPIIGNTTHFLGRKLSSQQFSQPISNHGSGAYQIPWPYKWWFNTSQKLPHKLPGTQKSRWSKSNASEPWSCFPKPGMIRNDTCVFRMSYRYYGQLLYGLFMFILGKCVKIL